LNARTPFRRRNQEQPPAAAVRLFGTTSIAYGGNIGHNPQVDLSQRGRHNGGAADRQPAPTRVMDTNMSEGHRSAETFIQPNRYAIPPDTQQAQNRRHGGQDWSGSTAYRPGVPRPREMFCCRLDEESHTNNFKVFRLRENQSSRSILKHFLEFANGDNIHLSALQRMTSDTEHLI